MNELIDAAFVATVISVLAGVSTAFTLWRATGKLLTGLTLGTAAAVPGVWAGDPILPLSFAGVGGLALWWRRSGKIEPSAFHGMLAQGLLVVAGYLVYITGRILVRPGRAEAIANAREIVNFERALGLWLEPGLQDAFGQGIWADVINNFYLFVYYPLPAVALVILFLRDRPAYKILRDSLAISAVLALITFALFPVAPPRLVPGLGIFDTIAASGGERVLTNQYAAVPSLHVGWPALVGLVMAVRGPRWMRWISPLPAAAMTLTVIASGNHYWIDAAVGILYSVVPAILGFALLREPREEREPATQRSVG
jgi:hypothetical protein